MYFDTIANLRPLIRVLTFLGLWPVQNTPGTGTIFERYYLYYQLLLQVPFTFILATLMWMEVIFIQDMAYASEVLKITLSETVVVLKVLNMWRYASKSAKLLREWEKSDLFVPSTPKEREMWRRGQCTFDKLLGFYRIWSVVTVLLAFLSVVFMEIPQLPVPYWRPARLREANSWPLYVYDFMAVVFTCFCNIEIDYLQCYYLSHLTLCLRFIGTRMARLEGAGDDVKITTELLKLINMHQQVKRMVKRCEEIVSLPLLMQIILSSMIICFTAYYLQSLSFRSNPADFVAMIQYFIAMSLQIFFPCYYATELTVESLNLSKQLYICKWTGMSAYNRHLIYLYMQDLMQPIVLHAGNYFEIGLQIFSKTMNNAYSLLALLANVGDEEN